MARYDAVQQMYETKVRVKPPAVESPDTTKMIEPMRNGEDRVHFVANEKVKKRLSQGWTLLDKPVEPETPEGDKQANT